MSPVFSQLCVELEKVKFLAKFVRQPVDEIWSFVHGWRMVIYDRFGGILALVLVASLSELIVVSFHWTGNLLSDGDTRNGHSTNFPNISRFSQLVRVITYSTSIASGV